MLPAGGSAQPSIPIWRAMLGSLLLLVGSFPPSQTPGPASGQTPTATATTLTFLAEADTYVTSRRSRQNFGSGPALRTDGQPQVRSFLRFHLDGFDAPVSRAVIRIFAGSTNATGIEVRGVASNSWGETTLTHRNSPRVLPPLDSSGLIRAGTWIEMDVTSLLKGGDAVSLALTSSSVTATRLASRESSTPPQLVLSTSADLSPSSPDGSGRAQSPTPPTSIGGSFPASPPPPRSRSLLSRSFVVMGAGDIACEPPSLPGLSSCHEFYTSQLLASADLVLTFGDNQYEDATLDKFLRSYDLSWGRFKHKTRPAVGNHEYLTSSAGGYFDYFGSLAGERGKGYYSFDAGGWHFVALNSECSDVGGCGPGSPQYEWLRADLAASSAPCTAAYWHHPRFSAGKYHDDASYQPFWELLFADGAEVVMAGHDHNYQRYAPMTPQGARDDSRGIRQFIVGTGGKNHYPVDSVAAPNREVANGSTFGVLKLTLRSDGYDWAFVPAVGGSFTDTGSGACH